MKIFLTGGNGMLGKSLLKKNNELPDCLKHDFISPSSKECNLLSKEEIKNFLSINKPELIIHAAGKVGGIKDNISNQYLYGYENMQMYLNLFQAIKELDLKCKVINIGSSCMYPRNMQQPLKIEYLGSGELEPTNESYAYAKLFGSRLGEHLLKDNCKTIIAPNLYGPNDKFDLQHSHLIASIIMKLHKAKTQGIKVYELDRQHEDIRREFMYVDDFANTVMYAIENWEMMPSVLNSGIGYDYSIKEYYDLTSKIVEIELSYLDKETDIPKGMKQKLLDSSDAFKLGLFPKTSLRDGILNTYNWYVDNII